MNRWSVENGEGEECGSLIVAQLIDLTSEQLGQWNVARLPRSAPNEPFKVQGITRCATAKTFGDVIVTEQHLDIIGIEASKREPGGSGDQPRLS